jgi:Kef-type K+ transport system membrane component KefB/voltage-gated potassium channel Kch
MHTLLSDIGLAIIFAAGIGAIFYRLGLPLLLAYLVAGVLLGPNLGFHLITSQESISTVSEIGLVLLMFILGLEIDVRKIVQLGTAVLVNGVTQFALCALLALLSFGLLGYAHAFGNYTLVYVAVATSLSSTLIVVKVLSDRMELGTLTSRISLGILVLQDIWAITFLAIQPRLTHLNPGAIAISIGGAALLLGIGIGLAKFALPFVFHRIAKQPELMLIAAIGWCAVMAGFATGLHLSVEMGALFAGVCIASFPYQGDVAAKIAPLRDFFITLFFVALGLQIPKPTGAVLFTALAIVAFVLVSRFLTVFPVLYLLRYGNRAAFVTSLNLSQLSEFALVLAALGVGYGHIDNALLSSFILAMTVAALISALAIPKSHEIFRAVNPFLERLGFRDRIASDEVPGEQHAKIPPIVLLGFYREASSLISEIEGRRGSLDDIMVIDFNPESLATLRERGIACEYGDVSNSATLEHLGLERARTLICTIPDHLFKGTNNLGLYHVLRRLAPSATIVLNAETIESARLMYAAGADYVMVSRIVSAHYLTDVLEKISAGDLPAIRTRAAAFMDLRVEVLP